MLSLGMERFAADSYQAANLVLAGFENRSLKVSMPMTAMLISLLWML